MTPLLPAELCDVIVDHAHRDTDALLLFSLVCRDWMRTSRYHLFSTIQLTHKNSQAFLSFLTDPRSTIVPVLSKLELRNGEYDRAWVDDVIPLLPRMGHVHHLSIYSAHQPLPLETRQALTTRFGNVRCLQLFDFELDVANDVFSMICAFPYLTMVTLDGGWRRGIQDLQVGGGNRLVSFDQHLPISPYLQTMDLLCSTEDVLEAVLSLVPIPSIQTLCLRHLAMPDIPRITEYLRILGPSLKHLTLGYRDFCWEGTDLALNTELVSLRVIYPLQQPKQSGTIIPVADIIRNIQSPSLEELTLAFRTEVEDSVLEALCEGMETALQEANFYQSLKNVAFWFGDKMKNGQADHFRNKLQKVVESGVQLSLNPGWLRY